MLEKLEGTAVNTSSLDDKKTVLIQCTSSDVSNLLLVCVYLLLFTEDKTEM